MIDVIGEIITERRRQIEKENFSQTHDDAHEKFELAAAAACYAYPLSVVIDGHGLEIGFPNPGTLPLGWPESWDASWWKPSGDRRNLIKAAALIIAEIERIDRRRAAASSEPGEHQEVLDAIAAHNSGEDE